MKNYIKEARLLQLKAGIITEDQYNEAEDSEKAKQQILSKLDAIINSPKAIETATSVVKKLSDEDKQKILDFTSGISESAIKEVDLETITDKVLSKIGKRDEIYEGGELTTTEFILGQIIRGAPVVSLALGLQKAIELGGGPEALAKVGPTYFAAAIAGGTLILLGKIIKSIYFRKKYKTPKSNKVSGYNDFSKFGETDSELNELSPELLQRASDKATERGRSAQASKFSAASKDATERPEKADNRLSNIK
jgi:hypothetical protein